VTRSTCSRRSRAADPEPLFERLERRQPRPIQI
jgi:hypothetical protein